ncbi:hypothetical protein L2E82_29885 [Cichorium intybus]|uniref:Uncharacterized protein n=1 Tax=Cichorium intybus TaxID=13427 RepID=A0ACB9CZ04_CICIN|nr:hypothetical protein L2E82_29885 [Cichorium intybus]
MDTVIKKILQALTIQISMSSASTPAERSMIDSSIRKLNTGIPYNQQTDSNTQDHGVAKAIASLVLPSSENTQRRKKKTVNALLRFCLHEHNKARAVSLGLVPILMELLKDSQSGMQDEVIAIQSILSTHWEWNFALGNKDHREVVPILVEAIGSGSSSSKENAAAVLVALCSRDQKYLVEAKEHGVAEKLMDLQDHGTDKGKIIAKVLMSDIYNKIDVKALQS